MTNARPGTGSDPTAAGRVPVHLAALDLDKTLIFSARSLLLPVPVTSPAQDLPAGGGQTVGPVAGAEPAEVVEVERYNGAPQSYATVGELTLLAELDRVAVVVPVTTRTLAQYRRVDLGIRPRYAIAANGGHLLVDGEPDPAWAATVAADLTDCAPLAEMLAHAEQFAAGWARLVRTADDLFVYVVAHARTDIPDLTALTARAEAGGWSVSQQGRKVYLVPVALTKQRAVDEVRRRTGTRVQLAAGDSVLDIPMLLAADAAVRPAHGELHELAWTAPHVTITADAGGLAGEQLLAALLDRIHADHPMPTTRL
ncbi:sucrose-6-phosphate hydrolase [Frankia sp. R82]|uniref:sucrose-6-phosphate hydrolase n=1 Tax=Frankia sp. R82 TaxID=2950553 RepID=UPI002043AA56|nr:sucrose-6-phosphate hydrolase [Frankia sp. R82]MCM3884541.1 sucrose-6-phosphate hydrolase [Frankia sp. R82]